MDARLRLDYLQALGIEAWVPARILPNALPSPQCVVEVAQWLEETPAIDERPEAAAQTSVLAEVPELQAARAAVLPEPVPALPGRAPGPQVERVEADAVTSFLLHIIETDAGVLVVDTPGSRQHFTSAQQRLLQNLLGALGFTANHLEAIPARWPQVNAHHAPRGPDAAREWLHSLLDRRLQGCTHLLLLGDVACQQVCAQPLETLRGRRSSLAWSAAGVRASVSLSEMLEDPRRKMGVWRDLAGVE